jgi:hypothetical protein
MINIVMYPFYVLVAVGLYLWHFKNASIEIGLITGVIIGVNNSTHQETNYLDVYLGIVIITFIWDV